MQIATCPWKICLGAGKVKPTVSACSFDPETFSFTLCLWIKHFNQNYINPNQFFFSPWESNTGWVPLRQLNTSVKFLNLIQRCLSCWFFKKNYFTELRFPRTFPHTPGCIVQWRFHHLLMHTPNFTAFVSWDFLWGRYPQRTALGDQAHLSLTTCSLFHQAFVPVTSTGSICYWFDKRPAFISHLMPKEFLGKSAPMV